ncbi:hypothetical protein C0W57_07115 [Bacillus velezensis]|nr:hypothetical protein OY17_12465 [Bacillus sp. BH072]AUS15968.1 hypothetical protein C0W57_07115 [Bacillus velezensis]
MFVFCSYFSHVFYVTTSGVDVKFEGFIDVYCSEPVIMYNESQNKPYKSFEPGRPGAFRPDLKII